MSNRNKKFLWTLAFLIAVTLISGGDVSKKTKTSDKNLEITTHPSSIKTLFVNAEGGLRIRERPNTNAQMIILVPDGEEIEAIEYTEKDIVAGIKAPWVKVSYKNKTGWAFGGFLDTRKFKFCDNLNYPSMKIYFNYHTGTDEIYFDKDLMIKEIGLGSMGDVSDEILLKPDGSGLYHKGFVRGNDETPIRWKFSNNQIIIEGAFSEEISHPNPIGCGMMLPSICKDKGLKPESEEFKACMNKENEKCVNNLDDNGNPMQYKKFQVTYKVSLEKKGVVRVATQTEKSAPKTFRINNNSGSYAICEQK